MDEVIRDLVVIGLIGLVCFAGAAEYVYWRFGFDKIVASLHRLEENTMASRIHLNNMVNALHGRRVA